MGDGRDAAKRRKSEKGMGVAPGMSPGGRWKLLPAASRKSPLLCYNVETKLLVSVKGISNNFAGSEVSVS